MIVNFYFRLELINLWNYRENCATILVHLQSIFIEILKILIVRELIRNHIVI